MAKAADLKEIKKEIKPNKLQQDCINGINGKYLVLAGPGTGKTFSIIERIKNMVRLNIPVDKILCLTYTDAAANEMKKRITNEIKTEKELNIFTYHGFCSSIMEQYPDEFELNENYKIITNPISKAFLKECIDEINPKYYRTKKNDPYYYITKILAQIALIKQNRLNKETYEKNLKENPDWEPDIKFWENEVELFKQGKSKKRNIPTPQLEDAKNKVNKALELWEFYELYQEKMTKNRYIDFNDMINFVLEAFENSVFLEEIASKYDYIMVDEYQDTNKAQNEIVFNLVSHCDNVFVVGDSNQIIYRFQGANLETIDNFKEKFKDELKIKRFEENMRSTQSILKAAHEVILKDPLNFEIKLGLDKELVAKNEELQKKSNKVRLYKYLDLDQEYLEITDEIEALIESANCPQDNDGNKNLSEIAILLRTNAESKKFAQLLKTRNIPYQLKTGMDIFEAPAVNVLYFYIQFLINPNLYYQRFFELMTMEPFSINPHDYKILWEEKSKYKDVLDCLKNAPLEKFEQPQKFKDFLDTYEYLKDYKSRENIKNTILEIGSKTGIFNYYINGDINKYENILALKTFLDEAKGFCEVNKTSFIEEFYNYIETIKADDDAIMTGEDPVSYNAVQLLTYHGSKGKEFEYVYLPTLIKQKWESSTKSIKAEIPLDKSQYKDKDELKKLKLSELTKLLYVALTRAKHTLRLSYPESIDKKPRELTSLLSDVKELFEYKEFDEYNSETYFDEIKKMFIKRDYDYKKELANYINSILQNEKFAHSVSSINKYLACPRQYFYEKILKLESKDGNPNAASYGSAVHKALEEAAKSIKNAVIPTKEQFIKWFYDELKNLPMESYQQRKNFEKRGFDALDKYYCQILNLTQSQIDGVEQNFETEFEGVKFKGFIDRIDKNQDGTYTIIDYKTGNNKNSTIKPEAEHENYYNQMAMYKYFWEKLNNVVVSKTKFIYPEEFEKKNDGIEFNKEEIEAVVEKYKNAIKNIKQHNFEPSYNQNACEYCLHKEFCDLNRL